MRRARIAAIVGMVVAVLALGGAQPAVAQAEGGERITRFDSQVTVEPDGDVTVADRITYDFGPNERHGIERWIPVRFRYDDVRRGYDRVYPLTVVSVSAAPGTPAGYRVVEEGDVRVIRIGDPDRTISGTHTYDVTYRLGGVLNHFADHDELFLNLLGTGSEVPVDALDATVTVPGRIGRVACFAGQRDSRLPCAQATTDGARRATFRHDRLASGEGVTAVVGFPVGLVPTPAPILEERWSVQRAFALRTDTVAPAAGLLAAGVAGFGWLAWRMGRDRRFVGAPTDIVFGTVDGAEEPVPVGDRDPIPVEFVPPERLRPGQVGTLIDEQANVLDVTATIIDLAVRGYLRITEIPKEHWLGKADWELERLQPAQERVPLQRYERTLLTALFEDGSPVRLSDLKNTFASHLSEVRSQLYDDVVAQGWFRRRPDQVRTGWRAVGGLVIAAGVGLTVILARSTSYALLGLPVVLSGLVLLIGSRRFPRRTPQGYGTLRRMRGFKRFIDESEKDRARFAEQQHLFSEYLPYAVVFGATDKWARTFSGLDGTVPRTDWYVGSHAFTYAAFASSMDGFTVTTSGTMASTPASSGVSGFSGGGVGGGAGGGGAGSW